MRSDQVFVRTVTSDDLPDCARLFVRVFSEWTYRETWSLTRAHRYLGRFRSFDPEHCISHLFLSPSTLPGQSHNHVNYVFCMRF